MSKWDVIFYGCLILIVIGGIMLSYYFYTYEYSECTSNPINYQIEKYLTTTDADSIMVTVSFIKNGVNVHTEYFMSEPD